MIKANELRIGNILNYGYGSIKQGFVTSVSASGVSVNRTKSVLCKSGFISSIPLTEDWLVKFGFTKDSKYSMWYFNILFYGSICAWITDCVDVYLDNKNSNTTLGRVKLQYVHQLQNLYFALTGEELTTK